LEGSQSLLRSSAILKSSFEHRLNTIQSSLEENSSDEEAMRQGELVDEDIEKEEKLAKATGAEVK
jgi:hypothetical protein